MKIAKKLANPIHEKKVCNMVTEKQKKTLLTLKEELRTEWYRLMCGEILQAEFDEIDMLEAKYSTLCFVLRTLGVDE